MYPMINNYCRCHDQEEADRRLPEFIKVPAVVHFVSVEPMLGPVRMWWVDEDAGAFRGPGVRVSGGMTVDTADYPAEGYDDSQPWIDLVICGGESGPKARPMELAWARALRDDCAKASVAFFMKQMGGKRKPFPPIPEDLMIREFPEGGVSR